MDSLGDKLTYRDGEAVPAAAKVEMGTVAEGNTVSNGQAFL